MTEHILYIRGSACPHDEDKIKAETEDFEEKFAVLKAAGHEVTPVGNSADGFTLNAVTAAFKRDPKISIVLADVHGNILGKNHFMQGVPKSGKSRMAGTLWARTLYKKLALASRGKPLNVFMFSCGSGDGCIDAAKHLPLGSTMVNLVESGDVSSYMMPAECFDLPSGDYNFSEQLFLRILSKGIRDLNQSPQLTVSTAGDPFTQTWGMLDIAGTNFPDTTFSPEIEKEMQQYFKDHFTEKQIYDALRTIEMYIDVLYVNRQTTYRFATTPVEIPVKPDIDGFYKSLAKHELVGATAALGYYFTRKDCGAFQTWEADRYKIDPAEKYRSERGGFSGLFSPQPAPEPSPGN